MSKKKYVTLFNGCLWFVQQFARILPWLYDKNRNDELWNIVLNKKGLDAMKIF